MLALVLGRASRQRLINGLRIISSGDAHGLVTVANCCQSRCS